MGVHYDGLDGYRSYGLAWLGPILYPLALALIAQAFVVRDMLLTSWGKALASPLTKRLTGLAKAPAPDARVTILTCTVLFSEVVFAVFCIVQCIVNFSSRSFVGGASLCDFQAFYATYYTFASAGAFALVTLYGARVVVTSGGCVLFSRPMVILSGVGVHVAALLIAALPLMGVGDYMFATDYCQDNVEGKVFAPLLFVWLVGGFLIIAGATAAVVVMPQVCSRVLCTVRVASMDKQGEDSLHRVAVRLFCASTLYYGCVWLTSLVIIGLYWANGSVFDSPQWRAYGAQAIILHSNQLIVPLLVGMWWRPVMNAVVASGGKPVSEADPESLH